MFQKDTVLRKLQRILSGKGNKLFDNQVSFYNGIFGMTNPELFSEELVEYMEKAECCRVKNNKKQEIEAFFSGGLDNSSSNIGKHINDDWGMAIPKFHCVHYAQAEHKMEICKRLAAVIRYSRRRKGTGSGSRELNLQEVFCSLKKELSYASKILSQAETADDNLLAHILYEIVQTHLGERHNPEPHEKDTVFGKINMKQQIEEYFLNCDCYEATSMDFFLALQRMADKNVIASSNLAGFYYVGTEFVVKNEKGGVSGKYVVERNLEQAAYYFKQAASSQPPYAPALYSYGYMVLHGEAGERPAEQRMEEAEIYYRQAAAQNFHHAVSGLGELALLRAEQFINGADQEGDFERIVEELSAAIVFFDRAEKMGSFWGSIKAAQFLDNPAYEPYMEQVLRKAELDKKADARARWKNAVALGNVFAMVELALLDIRLGYMQEARGMLEQAAQMNYPEASYHLAQYFYGSGGFCPNDRMYAQSLEKAAYDGSARASIVLGKMAAERYLTAELCEEKEKQKRLALGWFQKAEEQNFCCFEKEVHDELRKLILPW